MTHSSGKLSRRPNWEKTWRDVAKVIAKRSLCSRDQVGAVIVDYNNRIVSTGYNGPPQGFKHDGLPCINWCTRPTNTDPEMAKIAFGSDFVSESPLDPCYRDCPSLHAEQNAISVCDRTAREGGTIYVTSHVCITCAKLIANSGIVRVVVDVRHARPHRSPEDSYNFLTKCGLTVATHEPVTR